MYSHKKISHVSTDLHVMEDAAATDVSTWRYHKSHLATRFGKSSRAFVCLTLFDLTLPHLLRETRGQPTTEDFEVRYRKVKKKERGALGQR